MCTGNCKNKWAFPLRYNQATQIYTSVQQVQWDKYLNGFEIYNSGNTNVYFNNGIIPPGGSKTFGGNFGEIYAGRLDINFRTPSPAPSTIINEVTVTQKFYLIEEDK